MADSPKDFALALSERALLESYQTNELFAWNASSKAALIKQIHAASVAVQGASVAEMVDLSVALAVKIDSELRWRAAIIANSPDHLIECCNMLPTQLEQSSDVELAAGSTLDGLIYWGSWRERPRIGYLFPG